MSTQSRLVKIINKAISMIEILTSIGSATAGVNGTLEASLFDPDGRTCTLTLVPATLNMVPDVFPVIPACIAIV